MVVLGLNDGQPVNFLCSCQLPPDGCKVSFALGLRIAEKLIKGLVAKPRVDCTSNSSLLGILVLLSELLLLCGDDIC